MKYLVFAIALIGIPVGAAFCFYCRKLFHFAGLALMLPFLVYESTTINFFSEEWYRGTARGMEVSLVHLICAVILLTLFVLNKVSRPFPDKGSIIYLIYFCWSFFSFWNADFSEFLGLPWFELWKMLLMHFIFWTVYSYLEYSRNAEAILNGLGIVIVVCFVTIVYQHYSGRYQPHGIFPHQNSMAMFMALAVPIFLSYYLNGRSDRYDWLVYLFVLACGSASLVRSYSRGALLVFPISLAITTALSFVFNMRLRLFSRLLPLVLLGILFGSLLLPRVIERFERAPEASKTTRIELNRVAINMIREKPLLGIGLNNWGIKVNPPYIYWEGTGRRVAPGRDFENYKDSIVETVYLLVGAECGLIGLALMLIWFFYYFAKACILCKRLAGTEWFFLPAGLVGGLMAIYFQSMLEWVLKQSMNFIELIICFALIAFMDNHWKELKGLTPHKMEEAS